MLAGHIHDSRHDGFLLQCKLTTPDLSEGGTILRYKDFSSLLCACVIAVNNTFEYGPFVNSKRSGFHLRKYRTSKVK